MVNVLRRFSKPIMLVITVIVVVSFTVWGPNMTQRDSKMVVGTLSGKPVTLDQWNRQLRKMKVYDALDMPYADVFLPVRGYGQMGQPVRELTGESVARALVFESQVDALGVTSTMEENNETFAQVPAFQGADGHFDEKQFELAAQRYLMPNGYSKDQIYDFLAGQVRLRSTFEIVGSAVTATPAQAKESLTKEQTKLEATYVELQQADFEKEVKLTDEDLKKAYEERKEQFKTLPQRRVKVASWTLPPLPAGQSPEAAKSERSRMLQEYGDKAYNMHEALAAPGANFENLAKEFGAAVVTTGFFDIQHPPAELEASSVIAQEAFKLTKAAPYSRHLTMADSLKNGAYLLVFEEEKAADQKPFETVKAELEAMLRKEKGNEALTAKAKELKSKLEEAMKGGKTFYAALEALGQKPVGLPIMGPRERAQGVKYAAPAMAAAGRLAPGQISDPVPQGRTMLLVYLDRRIAGEEKTFTPEAVKERQEGLAGQERSSAIRAWLTTKAEEAGATKEYFR